MDDFNFHEASPAPEPQPTARELAGLLVDGLRVTFFIAVATVAVLAGAVALTHCQ